MANNFTNNIRPYVEREIRLAAQARASGDCQLEFSHLENAHVLGQESTRFHMQVHCLMFVWAWRQRDLQECLGQVLRIMGALSKTAIGLVPSGNTGGGNVSPFKAMPINHELSKIIDKAKKAL